MMSGAASIQALVLHGAKDLRLVSTSRDFDKGQ